MIGYVDKIRERIMALFSQLVLSFLQNLVPPTSGNGPSKDSKRTVNPAQRILAASLAIWLVLTGCPFPAQAQSVTIISGQIPSEFAQPTNRASVQIEYDSGGASTIFPRPDGSWSAQIRSQAYQVRPIPPQGCPFCIADPPLRAGDGTSTSGLNFDIVNDRSFYQIRGKVTANGSDRGVGGIPIVFSPPIGAISQVITETGRNGELPAGEYVK